MGRNKLIIVDTDILKEPPLVHLNRLRLSCLVKDPEFFSGIHLYIRNFKGLDHFSSAIKTKRQSNINLRLPSLSSIFNI